MSWAKKYENLSLKELANAPVNALQGVGENDAKLWKNSFNVKNIGDLITLKYMKWAQAILALSETEK